MVMPITLITGYLGSGKTTLLNNILKNANGHKIAVIVNDIGEINVDANLISKENNIGENNKSIVALQNGCICCTLKLDLIEQIISLIKAECFDHIIIEASGVCEPIPIAQTISMIDGTYNKIKKLPKLVKLDNIISVVDSHRMKSEFCSGTSLVKDSIKEDDIENLLIQQIEFCTTIILNKIDMISDNDKKEMLSVIKALQPNAKLIETNYCNVDISEIIDQNAFSLRTAARSTGWAEALKQTPENEETGETDEYGISTFVYRSRKPFEMNIFSIFAKNHFPKEVIRCKGTVWFRDEPQNAYMFEQSGKEISATLFGTWVAAADEKTQKLMLQKHTNLIKKWDAKYGDRNIELVFIGKNMNKQKIIEDLNSCLAQ